MTVRFELDIFIEIGHGYQELNHPTNMSNTKSCL